MPVAAGQAILVFVSGNNAGGTLVLHATKAAVDATPPLSVGAIVAPGDPAPSGAGFGSINWPAVLSQTDVAFTATTNGIFVSSGGTTSTVALTGGASPIGGVFTILGQPAQAANGTTAFVASISGGAATQGLFLHSAGVTTPLVVAGDPAPDGGTFQNFIRGISISPNGSLVAFAADTSLSGNERLYVASVGVGVSGPLLGELTDLSPCDDTVRQIGAGVPLFNIADDGEIGMWIRGTNVDAVIHYYGFWLAVACEGAPTPLGGTYGAIGRTIRMNNQVGAQIAFESTVTLPGPDTEAVFRDSAFGVFVVAQRGQLTTSGATITNLPSNGYADVDDTGTTAFFAQTSAGNAALTAPPGGVPAIALAVFGPCGSSGLVRQIDTQIDSDGAGTLTFRAVCDDVRGIFRIPAGGSVAALATLDDPTPIGPGFLFDAPSGQNAFVAFTGTRTGAYRIHCMTAACDPVTTIAQPFDTVPGLPGESIVIIDPDVLSGQGDLVAFRATTRGGSFGRDALLASRSGVLELVTADGLTLPGTTMGIAAVGLASSPVAVDKRGVAFTADITDSNDSAASEGVYLARSGVTTEVARDTQVAPNGAAYGSLSSPLLKGARVYFHADTSLAPCYVRASGPTRTTLACQGDPLADSSGETLDTIYEDAPALASRGPVFAGRRGAPSFSDCLFTATTKGALPLTCTGDLLPFGGTISGSVGFAGTSIGAAKKRVVALASSSSASTGIYEFSPRAVVRIAANDQPTPLGGVYSLFEPPLSISGKTVAFVSDVIDGSRPSALFLAHLRR